MTLLVPPPGYPRRAPATSAWVVRAVAMFGGPSRSPMKRGSFGVVAGAPVVVIRSPMKRGSFTRCSKPSGAAITAMRSANGWTSGGFGRCAAWRAACESGGAGENITRQECFFVVPLLCHGEQTGQNRVDCMGMGRSKNQRVRTGWYQAAHPILRSNPAGDTTCRLHHPGEFPGALLKRGKISYRKHCCPHAGGQQLLEVA